MKTLLAHYLICADKSHTLHCCTINDNVATIFPYEQEIHSTEFHNGILLLANASALSHLDEIHNQISCCNTASQAVVPLLQFMAHNQPLQYKKDQPIAVLSINPPNISVIKL